MFIVGVVVLSCGVEVWGGAYILNAFVVEVWNVDLRLRGFLSVNRGGLDVGNIVVQASP